MSEESKTIEEFKITDGLVLSLFTVACLISVGVVITMMVGCPRYAVYSQGMAGRAALAEAEWSAQITIETARATKQSAEYLAEAQVKRAVEAAKAKKASAVYLAEAEVERAKGVAEANRIIGDSLQENEGYLRYLWIQGLHDGSSETIYIATEANMPILEATRRSAE